jgi:hypothetical protein
VSGISKKSFRRGQEGRVPPPPALPARLRVGVETMVAIPQQIYGGNCVKETDRRFNELKQLYFVCNRQETALSKVGVQAMV